MAGIYIHIPFCHKACHYCGFHFTTTLSGIDVMAEALTKELVLYQNSFKHPIETIYFGGGTPSILPIEVIGDLLTTIRENYQVVSQPEITLEANPEDLSEDFARGLKEIGINRLSIGVQTFDDELLSFINRNHNSQQAVEALTHSRKAGFENINLDLIYGLPNSSSSILRDDLSRLLASSPEHISIYAYTVESKTAFENWIRKGKIRGIDEETEATQFELIMLVLEDAGYEQYEISNFSKPGYYSRHNRAYWNLSPYLGIGPSAHSLDGDRRWTNTGTNFQYTRDLGRGLSPAVFEERKPQDLLNEYIFTSLRTSWGCDLALFKERWGFDFEHHSRSQMAALFQQGLATTSQNSLILTKKGKLLADHIASELFVEEEDFERLKGYTSD